ncbi:MAG TPA: sugar ABC transporter permease [Microbacterium sp.]|uniref:carbohydrate ABC transporter permease n=1 Tax=Microbacterium arabinogalactanolyticum TaxID=69365 RepID=UPI002556E4F0|nr:sugar ABC transporter permease [Microbacterium arabinogalactanolyticum]GLC86629.1 ABC transporter permease [Microbacterium arabinogalactanolyticum]HWU30648.1 sugar ABC transporter permease [Microbacterium sp.]
MRSHRWFTPWLLLAPAVIWVLVFSLWPFLNTVVLSFTDARPLQPVKGVGFAQYERLLTDEQFRYALITCLIYVIVCVPLLTVLPLLLALLVEKNIPGIALFRTTYYFPVIASVVVVALIWGWLFDSRGIINEGLQWMGLTDQPVAFLVDRWWMLAVSILLTVWKGLGYYMVVYLAALGNVGKDLHEAAMLDGAGSFRRFVSVTIPSVRGAMLLISVLVAVSAMRVFTELDVLSNGTGGPGGYNMSIVMLIRQVGSGLSGNLGYAAAISVALFLLTLIPLVAIALMNREKKAKVPA